MVRRIVLLAVLGALVIVPVALAATAGTYSGTETLSIDTSITHPFSLVVKHNKVTKVSFLATSNCSDLVETTGKSANIKIKNNAFSGKLNVGDGSYVKLTGKFKGHKVKGSFTGRAKGATGFCPVVKQTFKAALPGSVLVGGY
jgi:hypothetical protein